jgi:hypothetical protein
MTERERDAEVIDLDERRKKARLDRLLASNPRFREVKSGGGGVMIVGAPRKPLRGET